MARKTRKTRKPSLEDELQFALFRPEDIRDVQLDLFSEERSEDDPVMYLDLFS